MPTLEFKKLPLAEVAIRLRPARALQYSVSSIPRLHAALLSRFPEAGISSAYEVGLGPIEIPSPQPPLEFSGHTQGISIALQPDLVSVRWRAAESNQGNYPRFPRLHEELGWCIEQLSKLLGQYETHFVIANMSYSNVIVTETSRVADVLDRFFAPCVKPPLLSPESEFFALAFGWRSGTHDIALQITRGETTLPNGHKCPAYTLATTAGTKFAATSDPSAAVVAVHDELQTVFEKLLTDTAKQEWGYVATNS